MFFTLKEQTVKDKTVADAVTAARFILTEKYKVSQLCVNCISRTPSDKLFTIQQINSITDDLVSDSLFYR